MEEIIDAEYRELENLEEKTTDQLASEANTLWSQMESISNIGMMMAAQAGKRLTVIKNRLEHGAWERWAKDNLNFSLRKANNMMKLAEKMEDENSLFSNPQIFTDIGISKVWALLAAPEEVAEEATKNPDVPDMTVKELQDEIAKLKEEQKEKDQELESMECKRQKAEAKAKAMEQNADRLSTEVVNLEQKLKDTASSEESDKLKQELDKLKEKLKKAKSDADSQRITAVEAVRKIEREKAEAEAEAKFDEATRQLKESNQQAAKEIDRLQKLAGGNTELAIFKVKSEQLQQDFNACMMSIVDVATDNQEQASKLRNALRTVMEKLIERIEE